MRKGKSRKVSPEQALEFLEGFRKMQTGKDEPTKAISLRVPGNILTAYKTLAASEGRAYQSMMIQALRAYLAK
jgi:predicted DNA binding CopG/RHH family protein